MLTAVTDKSLASQIADLIPKLVQPYRHIDTEPSLETVCADAGARFQILEFKHSIPAWLADKRGRRVGLIDHLTCNEAFRVLSLPAHAAGYLDSQGKLQFLPYICAVWGIEREHYRGSIKAEYLHGADSFSSAWGEVQRQHSRSLGSGAQDFKTYAEKLLPHAEAEGECILLAYSASLRQLVLFNGLMAPMLQTCLTSIR
jgi:hypothetical protein